MMDNEKSCVQIMLQHWHWSWSARDTFENLAVPELVRKFSDFYETEGPFQFSQKPTTWRFSLSTALKYWELIQRVKKDQR
jgi:hypothetical protein